MHEAPEDPCDIAGRWSGEDAQSLFFQALMEHFPDRIYFKDLQSRFIGGSRSFFQLFGADGTSALGRTDFDFFTETHARAAFEDEQEIIRTGVPKLSMEEMETWPGGGRSWCSTSKAPFRDREGRIIGTFGISRDITAAKQAELEHKQMEVQLRQAQRLESIGSLAAGIAHEINTPTQFIGDNTAFLDSVLPELMAWLQGERDFLERMRRRLPDPEPAAERLRALEALDLDYLAAEVPKAVRQSLDGVARVARIVNAMRAFAHPGTDGKNLANLNRIVEDTVTVSRNEWRYVAELQTDLDPGLPPVPCLQAEMGQVLLNLIVNAAHAIEGVRDGEGALGQIQVTTRLEGAEAILSVSDTGTGIPEAIRDRIFDPFFTTKPVGKGTGQGLAIVHSVVVDRHGGQVEVLSRPGGGTEFRLRLPLAD